MIKYNLQPYFIKAVLLSCFFVCACENSLREVRELSKTKTSVEAATNVESYYSQDAIVKAKLTAPLMLMKHADTEITEFPKTLHVDFYNDSIKTESQLFARYGKYLRNQSQVLLRDSVVVYNVAHDTMRTNELWWDQNKGKFTTDKPVYIHNHDGSIINSIGMTASQDLNDIMLFKIQPTTFLYVADSTMPE